MKISNIDSINKILVIRLSSMGDVILTTSFIRQIKNHFKNAKIDFCTAIPYYEIFNCNPYIANIIQYNKNNSIKSIIKQKKGILKQNNGKRYDLVIDLQKNLRSKIFRKGMGKKTLLIKKHRLKKLALVKYKSTRIGSIPPIPENYLNTLNEFNIQNDGKGLEIWLEKDIKAGFYQPHEKIYSGSFRRISIAPGAFHYTKRWPVEKFIELIPELKNKYNSEIILIGGVKDKEICDKIAEECGVNVKNYSGSESISDTSEIIDSCDLMITNDTGVMHIAAARNIPIAALFGSTITRLGFAPYGVKYKIIEKELECRPCTHIGRDACPLGHFNCMNLIKTEDVLKAVDYLRK